MEEKTRSRLRWWPALILALVFGTLAGGGGAYLWQSRSHGTPDSADQLSALQMLDDGDPATARPVSQTTGAAPDQISFSRQNAITRAAAAVGPAVVTVTTTQIRVVRTNPFASGFWSQFFVPRYHREQIQSMGSGIIISHDGYVLTNDHVIEDADSIQVTLSSGITYPAQLVGDDRESDLALVKIGADNLPAAHLGNSDSLIIGEWAIALGNPFGNLLADAQPTVTVGVISAINRDIKRSPEDNRVYRKMIQTDAAINPGNSGGPLVNADGEVIGINSFIFSSSHGSEGVGFAIPVNQAKVIARDLIRYGEARPAWVGVGIQPLPAQAESPGFPMARGVIVSTVQPDSPADRAGLQVNDIIQHAARHTVANVADWDGVAAFWRPGDTVTVQYRRGEKTASAKLALVPRPLDEAKGTQAGFGLHVSNINHLMASQLGLENSAGAVVTKVDPNSQAATVGFERGDILRQVNSRPVKTVKEFEAMLKTAEAGGRAIIGVERDHQLYLTALDLR